MDHAEVSSESMPRFFIMWVELILLVIAPFGVPLSSQTSGPAGGASLDFLLGNWVGEGGGGMAEGTGGFSFHPDLKNAILVRNNEANYPVADGRPAYSHTDMTIIYRGQDSQSVIFLSERLASAPRYRLTYSRIGNDRVAILFEIAPASSPDRFAPYIRASARRK